MQGDEAGRSLLSQFLQCISAADCVGILKLSDPDIRLCIPGAGDVTLTQSSIGPTAICDWAKTVRDKCGKLTFELAKCVEDDHNVLAVGLMAIDDYPQLFSSEMAIRVQFSEGKISAFNLYFDTHALAQFRW